MIYEIYVLDDNVVEIGGEIWPVSDQLRAILAFVYCNRLEVRGKIDLPNYTIDEVLMREWSAEVFRKAARYRLALYMGKRIDEIAFEQLASYYPPRAPRRDDGRSKSRVPKIGYESPPGSGRWKR